MSPYIALVVYVIAAIITIVLYFIYEYKTNGKWPDTKGIVIPFVICVVIFFVVLGLIFYKVTVAWIVVVLLIISSLVASAFKIKEVVKP